MSSYEEAKEDGIKIVNYGLYNEFRKYIVKCNSCGKEMHIPRYDRKKINICEECKEKDKHTARKVKENNMLRLALKKIRKMIQYMPEAIKLDYENAIEEVEKIVFDKIKFDSSEEIMVAIELTKNHILFRHHEKICGYEVDFFLPDEKLILEVDGIIYHNTRIELDKIRDDQILDYIGSDYRVVRILDKSINYSVLNLMCIIEEYLTSGLVSSNYISDNWYYIYCLIHEL